MRSAISVAGVLAVLTLAGCHQGWPAIEGTRHKMLRGAQLITAYRADRSAVVHILFLTDRDVPRGSIGMGILNGPSEDGYELAFSYSEAETGFAVQSKPVTIIKREALEANGRKFQLSEGNLFIALVQQDGSLHLTQLNRVMQGPETRAEAESVLDVMKTMTRGIARVQHMKTF